MSRSLSALRELKRAFDEGLLSAVQFARYKISVLDGEEEVLTKWEVLGTAHPVSSEMLQPLQISINSLQQSVDTLLKRPVDSSTTIAPTTRVCSVNDTRVCSVNDSLNDSRAKAVLKTACKVGGDFVNMT